MSENRHCPFCRSPFCGRVGGLAPQCEGPGAPTAAFMHPDDNKPGAAAAFSGIELHELRHIQKLVCNRISPEAIIFCDPTDWGLMQVAVYRCRHTPSQHANHVTGGLRCKQQVVAMGRTYNTLKAAIEAARIHLQ